MTKKDKRLGIDPIEKRNKLAWLDKTEKQRGILTERQQDRKMDKHNTNIIAVKQKDVTKDKVTFYVSKEKMQAFKIMSIQQHKRFSDLITEAIDDIINKYSKTE